MVFFEEKRVSRTGERGLTYPSNLGLEKFCGLKTYWLFLWGYVIESQDFGTLPETNKTNNPRLST